MRRRFFNISGEIFDYSNYMTIEALDDEIIITMPTYVEYGIDGNGWYSLPVKEPLYVKRGKLVSFKGYQILTQGFGIINVNGKFNLKGNCLSLVFGDNARDITSIESYSYLFYYLFSDNAGLIEVDENFLPATTLANNCYDNMFNGCSSLTTAPALPATTLANNCYQSMFNGCSSLTTAPALPATTLANSCYQSMFKGCSSLTTAPALPATTLIDYCYYGMFHGCSKLNYIKMLATVSVSIWELYHWVEGVASTGTFVKNPAMNSLPTGTNGIPSGWTVVNDGKEITFYFDSVPFGGLYELKALDGMTWADWVPSPYNTIGVEMGDSYGDIHWGGMSVVYCDTGIWAKPEDLIINEYTYGV